MPTPVCLKIVLKKTPNYIWRRFVVPSGITLDRLHGVAQTVMGWENRRPHTFVVRKQSFFPPGEIPADGLPENDFTLGQLVHRTGAKLQYYYGPWEHDLVVDKLRYANPAWPYPIYGLEGVRACPPESCADVTEFTEYLKTTGDVHEFDLAAINHKFGVPGPIELPKREFIPTRSLASNQPNPLARLGRLMRQATE